MFPAAPSVRRPWWQFSLGSLLIAVTVASCGLGWIGRERSSAAEARGVLARFQKAGCVSHREPTPKWRDWIIGDDPRSNLTFICADGQKIGDEELQHAATLRSLKIFRLSGTKISDVGLARLSGLARLEALAVENTAVTADGIAKLKAALPKCEIFSDFDE